MTRIQDFYNDLVVKMDYDTEAVSFELIDGSVPDFASVQKKDDSLILYDNEEGDSKHWSAITIVNVETLSESLNFSDSRNVERAVKIDRRKDINIYETLCLYCAENDIEVSKISDEDFNGAVEIIETYGIKDVVQKPFFFWID